MFCTKCGAEAREGDVFCAACGQKLVINTEITEESTQIQTEGVVTEGATAPQEEQPKEAPTSTPKNKKVEGFGYGIASLVLGIVAIAMVDEIITALVCAILGLVFGVISSRKAKAENKKNGFAIAGTVCSCVAFGLMILIALATIIMLALGVVFELGSITDSFIYY